MAQLNLIRTAEELKVAVPVIKQVCDLLDMPVTNDIYDNHSRLFNREIDLKALALQARNAGKELLDFCRELAEIHSQRATTPEGPMTPEDYVARRFGVTQIMPGSTADYVLNLLKNVTSPLVHDAIAMHYDFASGQIKSLLSNGWSASGGESGAVLTNSFEGIKDTTRVNWKGLSGGPTNKTLKGTSPDK